MNKAFRVLLETKSASTKGSDAGAAAAAATGEEGCVPRLIAVHKAKYFADNDQNSLSLGPGGFVEALEFASGIKAHVVGKVNHTSFQK
jgi:hypothetical protein